MLSAKLFNKNVIGCLKQEPHYEKNAVT